jgi:dTDP-4-amino-4,6-dideoxygalactose transaminase
LVYEEKDFSVSKEFPIKTLALPIYPELEEGQIPYVFDIISDFMEKISWFFFWPEPRKSLDN